MNGLRARLLAILALFVLGAWVQSRVLPPFEGGDEWLQLAYVEHLRTTGTLPDRNATDSPIRQQSGQPPLTYAISSLPALALNLPPIDTQALWDNLQADSNNWFTPPNRFNRLDNNNVFYLSNIPANTIDTVRLLMSARTLAPLYGVIAIIAAYGVGWEVFRARGWALTVAAVFAFTPTFLHINSFLTTDGGATAGGTVVLWLALRGVRHGIGWRDALWLGLALGLATLAKVSGLLLAPTVALALWLGVPTLRDKVLRGLTLTVPFALTAGVWMLWGLLTYGDPLGTHSHRFEGQYFDPPLSPAEILARMPEVYLSYWAKFASAVYAHPITYGVLTVWLLVALMGYLLPRRNTSSMHGRGLLIMATLTGLVGIIYWVATINFITGRLLFPVHAALIVWIVGGWQRWSAIIGNTRARGLAVVPLAVMSLVLSPILIQRAYAPPDTRTVTDDSLNPIQIDYDDTMRLDAWDAPATLHADTLTPVTLCWQVLQPTARPAAYSLKIVKDGIPIGERTTVHGLGRYDAKRWQTGHRFCDVLDVPIGAVEAGATYDLLLVMLDAQTGAVDWEARTGDGTILPFPVIGQIAAP